MARYVETGNRAGGIDAHVNRFLTLPPAGNFPEWREARFPTREDIFIGALALGVVLAVLFVASTILTA